jgi:hypothetical protein
MSTRFATALALVVLAAGSVMGQATTAPTPKAPVRSYAPPKTAWGDPDLSGVYTNKDERGIPIEKPSQFEGTTT